MNGQASIILAVENANCGDNEVLFENIQGVQAVLAEISYVGMYVCSVLQK
jgi:hypothetical protein